MTLADWRRRLERRRAVADLRRQRKNALAKIQRTEARLDTESRILLACLPCYGEGYRQGVEDMDAVWRRNQ